MDEEQRGRKRTRSTAFNNQPDNNQQVQFHHSAIVESDPSDWDDFISSDSEEDGDYSSTDEEFSRSDIEFLEDEHSYFSLEMEEDDVDPDELSYEELIALGEMVGVESKSLSEAEINKHLHPVTCQSSNSLLIDRCVICQVEYEQGEKLVALHCDHPYHSGCITKWLQIKKICPICTNEVSSAKISTTL